MKKTWIEKWIERLSLAWSAPRAARELQELRLAQMELQVSALTQAEANCQRALKQTEEMCAFYKAAYEEAVERMEEDRQARIEASETLTDFLAQQKWGIAIYGRVQIPPGPDVSNMEPILSPRAPLVAEMRRRNRQFRNDLRTFVEKAARAPEASSKAPMTPSLQE